MANDGSAAIGGVAVSVWELVATVGMLALAGCSGGESETAASGTTDDGKITPTASGTAVEDTSTPTPFGAVAEETVICEHPDGYSVTYPADWHTYPNADDPDLGHFACGVFGTEPMEFEPATSMPPIPIRIWVWDGLPFETATQPEFRSGEAPSRDVEMQDTSVAGRPAVRMVSVSEAPEDAPPSDFYLPRGTEQVWWIVDLSTDTSDRVLLAHAIPPAAASTGVSEADKSPDGAANVDSTAEVLDAMMDSLTLTD